MNVLEYFKPVTTFIFDVDGVLTDGTVLVMDGGLQARRMNIKDGFALQMAVTKGYRVVIVSGGHSPQSADRLLRLGITEVNMSVADKQILYQNILLIINLKKKKYCIWLMICPIFR
jgi:3-deoxy-D-manno-octulosonate 8-phosphate phosphatase (KDO 8-P phosphatase)